MLIANDVVVEILSRLPAKSLLRFRWACKYWFDLITRDHVFIKPHLHRSTTHDEFFNIISLSVLHTSVRNRILQCYLNYNNTTRVGNVSTSDQVSIPLPLDYSLGHFPKIMGSCNGLVLLFNMHSEDLCIWNACTKEYVVLPRPLHREEGVDLKHAIRGYNYGFGYDHTNDDYKVIRNIFYKVKSAELVSYSDVQVYTLRTNSWRRIKPNPYILRTRSLSQGVFLNGVLYRVDCSDHHIICFDFGTEKFQHVSKIPNINRHDHNYYYVRIKVFEGSLCVVLTIKEQPYYCVEIWMMNVNAVNNNNESLWTRNEDIEPLWCTRNEDNHFIEPLRCIRNGDILVLINHRDLVLYDRKSNNAKLLYKNICKEDSHYVIQVYTESLVSLNSGTYKSQEQDDGLEK